MINLLNYKIIKKIASGGMGDVYLAEHEVLENKVAIKSLHPNLVGDESFRKRFRKEAKTQWKLSHPNIVKLVDFQEQEDGLFLIMEYIDGKQLNDYIIEDSGPIPEDKLIPLFTQVLSAIKYAHSKGLVHRDIKPANILITPEGNAKVLDFGIAQQSSEDSGLTKTGVQVGTVSYMSPEQVNAEKVDKLSDIYSLGVTLFQMAVGKAPYAGQTNQFKIQLSIVSNPFPKAKHHYPSVSDKLEAIIEKATQKNKSDRFQNCEEFIQSFKDTSPIVKEEKKTTEKEFKVKTENKTLEVKSKTENLKIDNKVGSAKDPVFLFILLFIAAALVFSYLSQSDNVEEIQSKSWSNGIEEIERKEAEDQKAINDVNVKAAEDRIAKNAAKVKAAEDRKAEADRKAAAKKVADRKASADRKAAAKKELNQKAATPKKTYDNNSNTVNKKYGSTRVRTFFYELPDVSSKPIKTLAPNSSFEYINMTLINDNFYKIKIGSNVGFIHQTGIKK